jgi:hypothetical protein
MSIALALFSALAGIFGVLLSSQATSGASVVGFAILVAVWARLVQAHDHHKAWLASQRPEQKSQPSAV